MPKKKQCNCRGGFAVNVTCPIHGLGATTLFKPEPQAETHPQTQMEIAPRPWRLGFGADDDSAHYIVSANGEIVAELDTQNSIVDAKHSKLIILAVNSFDDLLEALKLVWDCPYDSERRIRDVAAIQAARAKAESHS